MRKVVSKIIPEGGINFTQAIILVAICILGIYLLKVALHISAMFLLKFLVPVIAIIWLVGKFKRITKERNKNDDNSSY